MVEQRVYDPEGRLLRLVEIRNRLTNFTRTYQYGENYFTVTENPPFRERKIAYDGGVIEEISKISRKDFIDKEYEFFSNNQSVKIKIK